jgi:hypothetical protein
MDDDPSFAILCQDMATPRSAFVYIPGYCTDAGLPACVHLFFVRNDVSSLQIERKRVAVVTAIMAEPRGLATGLLVAHRNGWLVFYLRAGSVSAVAIRFKMFIPPIHS